ncbi:MAG: FxsA family protein [Actinomycetota bacterium]|nr:FxsA family protein [Actinomycetota bacterium]MDQ3719285.1 FxsA family protein [Actinomycetota bacterium]
MRLIGLVVLFILLPIAEIALLYQVGDAIGILWTVALLIADSIIGSLLLRSQGRAVWRRFQGTMESGRMPHREVQDGVLVVFGGALLITPGFLTDILGLLLLIPPTRSVIRRFVMRALAQRAADRVEGGVWDVEGTATEVELPRQRLER